MGQNQTEQLHYRNLRKRKQKKGQKVYVKK